MTISSLRVLPLALAVSATLPACAGDDDDGGPGGVDDIVVIGRAPCGARGHWDDGAVQTTRYTNDERKHYVRAVLTDESGAVIREITRGFAVDQLRWVDHVGASLNYRTELGYDDAGRTRLIVRTDRNLENGDDGYTLVNEYDGGRLVAYDIDYASAVAADVHATVTGNRTRTETSVECLVDDPTMCDTWVFEQPDGDPRHWTAGSWDMGSDGTIDVRYARTLDRHGLELTYVETDVTGDPAGVVTSRDTTHRDDDGTELDSSFELFNPDGTRADTFVRENDFVCDAARLAPSRPPSASDRPEMLAPWTPTPSQPSLEVRQRGRRAR